MHKVYSKGIRNVNHKHKRENLLDLCILWFLKYSQGQKLSSIENIRCYPAILQHLSFL